MNSQVKPARIDVFYKPGLSMNDSALENFSVMIKDAAASCFGALPDYQVMRGTRDELRDKVIAVAWSDATKTQIDGFCSSVLLPVEGVGEVLHLGLTCVRPSARSRGLTHVLTHKAVASQLFRTSPIIGKLWISNCAAVLSSLVNVALYFENVYPSPFARSRKTKEYDLIAAAIDAYYRDKMFINDDAVFDGESFIFQKSVKNTVFQKEGSDPTFHHRNRILNSYYQGILDFDRGDEVLQIGYASTFAAIKHMLRMNNKKVHPAYIQDDETFEEKVARTA